MTTLAIETKNLGKRFGKQEAVSDLNLRVPAGTLFGLIGPNGAGKTTTLRMLAGLIPPSSGSIYLGGQKVDAMRHQSKVSWKVGYMPDFFGVYEDMLVWEYLDFFARCYGVAPDRRGRLVDELLELVDLGGKRESDVETLSRGMKQRLCLAHALVHDPDILLLDEPASGLDPRARLEMRELLLELRAMGKTIVISSHILTEMGQMCDAVAIMEQGKLLAGGDVAEIERSVSPGQAVELRALAREDEIRAALAGLPGIHFLPEDVDVDGEREASVARPATEMIFFVEGEPEVHAQVLAALVGAGIQVLGYRPRERDLERMFMEITKGEVS